MKAKNAFVVELERPLAFFDIEATGVNPRTDRIVELAIIRVMPDNSRLSYVQRVNPGVPIPPEVSKIHGITDKDVEKSPRFAEIAPEIHRILEGCDLAGYNVLRYDIPMLQEEMMRVGYNLDVSDRLVVDSQRIFHKKEPRDLSAALAFYCGEMHLNAHGAESDVLATIKVFEGQYAKYNDLPATVTELDKFCNPREPDWVDRAGRLKWDKGEVVLNFGKKKGEKLKDIIAHDLGFIKWMLRSDFPRDTQLIVQEAAEGKWPVPPAPEPVVPVE